MGVKRSPNNFEGILAQGAKQRCGTKEEEVTGLRKPYAKEHKLNSSKTPYYGNPISIIACTEQRNKKGKAVPVFN
jgi:hypothetical protein